MDQTEFFRQCVDIYTGSLHELQQQQVEDQSRVKKVAKNQDYQIANSEFFTKSTSIHNALVSLISLLQTIRPQYLLANSRELSEEQKMTIDTEIKIKIQKLTNKIKNFQDAESRIKPMSADSEELTAALEKIGFSIVNNSWSVLQSLTRNLISMGDYSEYISIRNETLRTVFSNIVKSLALLLNNALLTWNDMHDKRVERLVQLKKSALSTSYTNHKQNKPQIVNNKKNMNMFNFHSNSDDNINTKPNSISFQDDQRYVTEDYEMLNDQLPEQELLQLKAEQDSLAEELKKGTLDAVTQIEQSMIDVASMVREIGVQLSMQNENISILDQHKDEIVGNVKSGNVVLVKANERNSQMNKTFAWAIFIAALILLIVDYIL